MSLYIIKTDTKIKERSTFAQSHTHRPLSPPLGAISCL